MADDYTYNPNTGRWDLPEPQTLFLEWLLERAPTERYSTYSKTSGVPETVLRQWRMHPKFKAEWRFRIENEVTGPEVMQAHLAALDAKARNGDVQAAKLYWNIIGRLAPKGAVEEPTLEPSDMTDEQLAAALRAEADKLHGS